MHCLWREIIKTFILFVSGIYDESPISSFCCLSIIMEDFIRWGAAGAGQESVFTERSSSWQLSRRSHRGESRCMVTPGFSHFTCCLWCPVSRVAQSLAVEVISSVSASWLLSCRSLLSRMKGGWCLRVSTSPPRSPGGLSSSRSSPRTW